MKTFRLLPPLFLLLISALPAGNLQASSAAVLRSGAAASWAAVAGDPARLPYVNRIYTEPEHPFSGDSVSVVIEGVFPYRCGEVVRRPRTLIDFELRPTESRENCSGVWREVFALGALRAGTHQVGIRLGVAPPAEHTGEFISSITFAVSDSDTTTPPPHGPLPYVSFMRVTRLRDDGQPICPGDSLLFRIGGLFPNPCFVFRRIEIHPIMTSDFRETPISYQLLVVVDDMGCTLQLCDSIRTPWEAAIALPPVPIPGHFGIGVALAKVTCDGPIPQPPLPSDIAFFDVSKRCAGPPVGCIQGLFVRNPDGLCDAFVSRSHPAVVAFRVLTHVALSGLQGAFRVSPPWLHVTNIETTGPAIGMHLRWEPDAEGAKFVLFAESGAPIPPTDGDSSGVGAVLNVTLEQPSVEPGTPVTYVRSENLLGSDIDGHELTTCPEPAMRPGIDAFSARICTERDCDFNADGRIDVSDLVLMVHCWNGVTPCDHPADLFDCNGDHEFTLDDVLCCADRILGRNPCAGCPPDSGHSRPGTGIALSLGSAVRTRDGFDVTVRLAGAYLLGGAKLAFEFPVDRFVGSVEFPGISDHWLHLTQVRDGKLVIGLIYTAAMAPADLHGIDAVLHFVLREGKQPGGELRMSESEFSAPDGVKYDVAIDGTPLPLGGTGLLALSAARPNPFSTGSTFTLAVDRSSSIEVGIYDVGGRLVAPLHHGALEAGTHEFRWDGRYESGAHAPDGIYFYRATGGVESVSRKMILMRGSGQ